MSRILSMAACLAMIFVVPVCAQAQKQRKWDDQTYKYELRAGWGTPDYNLYYSNVYESDIFENIGSELDDMYKLQRGSLYSSGAVFAEFNMNFRKWFTFSTRTSFNAYWAEIYDPAEDRTADVVGGCIVSLIPTARFNYVSRPIFRMYASIGVGLMTDISGSGLQAEPAFQFTPVGVAVGRAVTGFCEMVFEKNNNIPGLYFGVGYGF